MPITTTRAQRRRLAIENAKWPTTLEEVPEAEWCRAPFVPEGLTKVFRSRDFHVQVYSAEAQAIYRITVGRTVLDEDGGR